MASSRDLLLLTIETLTENAFDVIMHRRALVADLKMRIRYITGIDTTDQHILMGSVELRDDQTLEHYRIETGSKLRLVTSMRGGPISFRRPSPVPPFINLAAFLLAAAESESPTDTKKHSTENTDKGQPVAYYIIHDGIIVKITEFETDSASEDSKSFLKKMSKDVLSRASKGNDEEEIKRMIENERTKEKMKNIRKNMDHANEVREKLKAKRLSRPEPPRVFSPSAHTRETLPLINYSGTQSKASSKRSTNVSDKIEEREHNMNEQQHQQQHKQQQQRDKLKSMNSTFQKPINDQKQFKEFLKVRPVALLEKQTPNFTHMLPVVSSTGTDFEDFLDLGKTHRYSNKSQKLERRGFSLQSNRAQGVNYYYSSYDPTSQSRPIYSPGFLGSNYERFINEEEFMRQTRSMEERTKSAEFSVNAQPNITSQSAFRTSVRDDGKYLREKRGSSNAYFDSLITLMAQTIMGSSRRSFERRSSSGHNKIGLTSRRFTHDGRTNENPMPLKDSTNTLPPLRTAKVNLGQTETFRKSRETRPLGMVVVDRCAVCSKKLGIATTFRCRCDKMFCVNHKFPEEHQCDFDYKKAGREQIKKNNPVVDGNKLNKI